MSRVRHIIMTGYVLMSVMILTLVVCLPHAEAETRPTSLPRAVSTHNLPTLPSAAPVRTPGSITKTVVRYRYLPQDTRTVYLRPETETVTATRKVTATKTIRQTKTKTATMTVTETVHPENRVIITPAKAAGLSVGLIVVGILLTLLGLWISFALGYFKGDDGNRQFIENTVDELKIK